jgi:hypothetical protein
MSIVEKLTEGIVNRDMAKEGAALLNKWSSTGLLEGLQTDREKANMARLLENQARELLRESTAAAGGDIEGFAAVAFPIVRRVFAGLIANDLVSVQPMSLPSGLIFFLDFTFSDNIGDGNTADALRTGNASGASIYGTDKVGKNIQTGVNLVDSLGADLSGPGRGGSTGYAYASPTGSFDVAAGNLATTKFESIALTSSMSNANLKLIRYDADLLTHQTSGGAAHTHNILKVTIPSANVPTDLDTDNLSPVQVTPDQISAAGVADVSNDARQVRRLSQLDSSGNLLLFFIGTSGSAVKDGISGANADLTGSYPLRDTFTVSGLSEGAVRGNVFALEAETEIPEIDIKVDSIAITAQTKKLKAKWTPELGQDLNAYHNLDAEVELTSILSEQIALEIDREILADLVNGATAATYYWSRSPGMFLNRVTGEEIGASAVAPDFTGTVSEWYETLIETINDVSAQIHRKTLRGGANYVVVSPEVANILEFTAGFRANVTADAESGEIGAVKVGSLNRKFDVIVDPYFPRNAILVGRRGNSFLESGYVYAPYVPLQTTPTIFGPEDFVPRKGVMTRYAKKMVRPDMYGLVICRGLLGESGS